MKIAVDVFGGDYAPQATIEGSLQALQRFADVELLLFGDESYCDGASLHYKKVGAKAMAVIPRYWGRRIFDILWLSYAGGDGTGRQLRRGHRNNKGLLGRDAGSWSDFLLGRFRYGLAAGSQNR